MSIHVKNISKRFGDFVALDDVIAGFPSRRTGRAARALRLRQDHAAAHHRRPGSRPTAGSVLARRRGCLAATHVRERQVGFVFQHYALFRHMTVFDNVAFGLRVKPRKPAPGARPRSRSKVHELLEAGAARLAGRPLPVATCPAGSASASPWPARWRSSRKVLLLDEPFGALDAKVRKELRRWLRSLHDEMHITSIFVTHDQEEALEVADRVVVMNHGQVEQIGTPDEVYEQSGDALRLQLSRRGESVPRTRAWRYAEGGRP